MKRTMYTLFFASLLLNGVTAKAEEGTTTRLTTMSEASTAMAQPSTTREEPSTTVVIESTENKEMTSAASSVTEVVTTPSSIVQNEAVHEEAFAVSMPLYRLYHSGLRVHLYTRDRNEYQVLGSRGWRQEGVSWNYESSGRYDKVYRLYHEGLKVHLYTKDTNEYAVLAQRGWRQEGVAFYSQGEIPVYRVYHEGIKRHLYTTDVNEYNVLGKRGWRQEGVAFYAFNTGKPIQPAPQPKPVPKTTTTTNVKVTTKKSSQPTVTTTTKRQVPKTTVSNRDALLAKLTAAKQAVAKAQAAVTTAKANLTTAQQADTKRAAAIQTAQSDVNAKAKIVETAKKRVTSAQNTVKSATDILTKANDAVTKAQDALNNVDTVTIGDGRLEKLDGTYDSLTFKNYYDIWVANKSEDNHDILVGSGVEAVDHSATHIKESDKNKIVNLLNLSKENKEELALYALQVLNTSREKLGLKPLEVTTGGMTAAQRQADCYTTQKHNPWQSGHIIGDYFGENLSPLINGTTTTMYDAKQQIFDAMLSFTYLDAPSKWEHARNSMTGTGHLGIAFMSFNNGKTTWLVNNFGVYSGTPIANPNDPAKLQAALAKAQADKIKAQTASAQAKAELTKANTAYTAAVTAKTKADKALVAAQATPLQTPTAQNNVSQATTALQKAQAHLKDLQDQLNRLK